MFLAAACALAAADPTVLRVVSYNIRTGGVGMDDKRDLARQAAVLKALKPDIVLLQEVDVGAKRSGKVDTAGVIAEALGFKSYFTQAIPLQGGSYGVAVLTAFPAGPFTTQRFLGGAEPRVALLLPVRVPTSAGERELLVVCTHLDFRSDDEMEPCAKQLANVLAVEQRPVVLGGDMNFWPGSKVITALEKQLTLIPKTGERATYPADKPKSDIDHFFVRPAAAFKVRESRVVPESVASDHRPILVELEWLPSSR